MSNDTD